MFAKQKDCVSCSFLSYLVMFLRFRIVVRFQEGLPKGLNRIVVYLFRFVLELLSNLKLYR